jgi:drug/metabolite transporter (DMT)-like permease
MSNINSTISIPNTNLTRIALGALVCGAFAIGFAPIFVRLSEVGPGATAFWRILLALPVLWLWMAVEGQNTTAPRQPTRPADYRWLAAAGLFFAGDIAVWHWSLQFTFVANATLLVNFAPIFVTLGAWLLWKQRINWIFLLGLAVALAGAVMLIGASFQLSAQNLLGDVLSLLAAVSYGGYILTVKQLRNHFSVATIMAWGGLFSCAAVFLAALLAGEQFIALSLQGWVVLIALALLSHVGGQGLIAYALAHLPAPFSSVTLLLQPVISTFLAWLILDEVLGPWQALGGIIVLVGIWLARRGSKM